MYYLCAAIYIYTMKTGTKIGLGILGALIALIAAAIIGADIWVSKLVNRQVDAALAKIEGGVAASCGTIHVRFLSGTAEVNDLYFTTDSTLADGQPGFTASIKRIEVGRVLYSELLRSHRLRFFNINIVEPHLSLTFDDKNPKSCLPALHDTTLATAGQWLESIYIHHLNIENASALIRSTRTHLRVEADSLSVGLEDLLYSFADSLFTYDDTQYELSLGSLKTTLPDGLMALETHDVKTRDEGPLKIGRTRFYHTIQPKQLAKRMKEPVTWIDIELNSLTTSAFNPIHKAQNKDWTLDSLSVDVNKMRVARNECYPPKRPYKMPQEVLLKIKEHFHIRSINALVHKIDVSFASTDINNGKLALRNIRAQIKDAGNKSGTIWHNTISGPMGKEGKISASMALHMDASSTFDCSITGSNLETDYLNSFIRPLVGMTCDCRITQLDVNYTGNNQQITGDFCMQYKGLKIQVHEEDDIPYKVVTKNAKTINNLANTLIPKSNPTSVDNGPRRYNVVWKRDVWKPFEFYMFAPCIDGVKKTMLPGLYVHEQVRPQKAKKTDAD